MKNGVSRSQQDQQLPVDAWKTSIEIARSVTVETDEMLLFWHPPAVFGQWTPVSISRHEIITSQLHRHNAKCITTGVLAHLDHINNSLFHSEQLCHRWR